MNSQNDLDFLLVLLFIAGFYVESWREDRAQQRRWKEEAETKARRQAESVRRYREAMARGAELEAKRNEKADEE